MLQLLIGIVVFVVAAFAAVPFFRHRHVSGVPGAYYLEQKFQALVVDLWREYLVSSALSSEDLHDPEALARVAIVYAGVFREAVEERKYDSEIELYLRDFVQRRGEQDLFRTIIATLLDYQCRDNPVLHRQAMMEVLQRQGQQR